MSRQPEVRCSLDDDVGAIHAIYAPEVVHGTASFELRPPDLVEMAARRHAVIELGCPFLVAELDGRVCGYAYAGPYWHRPGYRHTLENSVYVADWGRRCGVGRSLLTCLVDQCEALGYRQMVGVIGDSAHVASIRLHEQCGFRVVGCLENVGFKLGRWLDTVIMQRSLGEGACSDPP